MSFASKVRPRTFGCVAMGSAVQFILRFIFLFYSEGSGANRVQVVLSGFSVRLSMNLIIVPGILVCSSFLISVCMFIVSKALLISSATVIVRAGGALCYCVVSMCVVPSL